MNPGATFLRCKLCDSAEVSPRYRLRADDTPFDLFECAGCGFRFIDHLDADASSTEPVDVAAASADVAAGLESNAERIQQNARLVLARGGESLLDVGSGAGAFLASVSPRFRRTVGVDPDRAYSAVARSRGLDVQVGRIEDAAFDGQRFDAVTMWDVIEHVNDPRGTVARALELLNSGGALFLDTPSRDGFLYRFGEFTARITGGRVTSTMGLQYSPAPFCHKQIFRKSDLRRLLAEFREVTITERFELSFPADFYLRRWLPGVVARVAGPIAKLVLRLLPIRNKLIVVAVK